MSVVILSIQSIYLLLPLSYFLQSRSLFVKNLNFKTSDESLRKHFSEHMKGGRILSAKVYLDLGSSFCWSREVQCSLALFLDYQVKKHIKKGQHVSMGFGFLEFDSVETATSVCSNWQVIMLSMQFFTLHISLGIN